MDQNLVAFLQAAPPVIVGLVILYLIIRGLITLAEKIITALRDLGSKFLATINGYFAAMNEHNTLTRQAIKESAAIQQQALAKLATSNETTGGNLERMAGLLTAINEALDATKAATDQGKSEILQAVNESSTTLKQQGDSLMSALTPIGTKVNEGFGEVTDILNKIDDKLDTNATALVKQLADQFKPIFEEMLAANRTITQLSQEIVTVQSKIEESSARLERTFLNALAGIVTAPPASPVAPVPVSETSLPDNANHAPVNGAVTNGEVQP